MKHNRTRIAALVATVAFGAGAAPGLAAGAPSSHSTDNPGATHRPAGTTTTPGPTTTPVGPTATPAAKGKAYGKYCQGQSKKHVAGEKGTAFSRCVTGMAKLATGATDSPTTACKTMSKKHVKGEKGTAFSRCVSAAAKLLKDKHDDA